MPRIAQLTAHLRSHMRLLILPAIVIAAVVGIAACNGSGGNGDDDSTAVTNTPTNTSTSGTETATASRTPRLTSTPRPEQTASAEAVQAIRSLNEFVDEYGYPQDANFASIRIPRLGVDAQVASRLVGGDGVMAEPEGPAEVVWYDLSAWGGMGGAPGSGGNAIFSGHVDYNWTVGYADGARYRGPGVFRELAALTDGDIIEVDYNGETLRYAVVSKQQLDAAAGDWGSVWSSAGGDAITLYTCGGDFDATTASYADRVVVRAERIQ